jgi:predicted NBD/HSP70 family sugar kinase
VLRIGIDLGGTKTEVIALDERGAECLRRREPSPAGDYDATIALIARLVRESEIEVGKRGQRRRGHTRRALARHAPPSYSNFHAPQRPAVQGRPRADARP